MTVVFLPEPNADDCIVVLVRHGATDNNLADPPILQGRSINCGLSDQGKRQAQATQGLLRDVSVSAVYASPLVRADETAQIIAAPHGLSVTHVEALTEVDVGRWEHRSWVDIAVEDPEPYRNFMEDPAVHGYLGGENLTDVLHRTLPAIERIVHQHANQIVVIVAHNVVNRVLLAHGLGLPVKAARTVVQDNCGVNVVRWSGKSIKVKTLNSSFHLP